MDNGFMIAVRPRFEKLLHEGAGKRDALYASIRDAMLAGAIPPDSRLPATRELAAALGLSRGVAGAAYDMLHAEGYVNAAVGRGTFAVYRPPAGGGRRRGADGANGAAGEEAALPLSAWSRRLAEGAVHPPSEPVEAPPYDLRIGVTPLSAFPEAEWKRAVYAEVRDFARLSGRDAFASEGHGPLRSAIARHLALTRGIRAEPDEIVVTNGSMQAIALLAMLLLDPGDRAVIENPGYPGIRAAIRTAGGEPLAAPVDKSGIVPDDWPARLAFVTPGRQFPTGAVLPASRRIALLEWAERRSAVIVEDDYDSEFRWGGRPSEPLKAMDRTGRVVYIGTFSKTMLPDIRIGYAVLPPALAGSFRQAKYWTEPHPAGLAWQRALARFMAEGEYARHLRRMQRLCGRRLQRFRALAAALPGKPFDWYPAESGLHIYGEWRGAPERYDAWRAACLAEGIVWTDGTRYRSDDAAVRSALFGFAHLNDAAMADAVGRMADVLRGIG